MYSAESLSDVLKTWGLLLSESLCLCSLADGELRLMEVWSWAAGVQGGEERQGGEGCAAEEEGALLFGSLFSSTVVSAGFGRTLTRPPLDLATDEELPWSLDAGGTVGTGSPPPCGRRAAAKLCAAASESVAGALASRCTAAALSGLLSP